MPFVKFHGLVATLCKLLNFLDQDWKERKKPKETENVLVVLVRTLNTFIGPKFEEEWSQRIKTLGDAKFLNRKYDLSKAQIEEKTVTFKMWHLRN